MILDHIGIVVPDLARGVERWERLFGYQPNSDVVCNTRQKVRVVFLAKPGSLAVKLIEPTAPESPAFPTASKGGGLHHLCFRCAALAAAIPRLQQLGARLLVPPQPGEAFNNHQIAFLLAGNNLNFELIDTHEKQGWGACALGELAQGSAP
jgi:methylmalonyl-CoA/ethylmalonyl-CoA epimerase